MEASSTKGNGQRAQSSPRLERKTVERNRRVLMKSLFTKLDAVLPRSKQGAVGFSGRLDDATCYIRNLKWRLAMLKQRRESMDRPAAACGDPEAAAPALPHVEVRDLGSALEVVLVSRRRDRLVFYEMVRVLEEEGAEIVNAGFTVVEDKAFHSVLSQVGESRRDHVIRCIPERLRKLTHESIGAARLPCWGQGGV